MYWLKIETDNNAAIRNHDSRHDVGIENKELKILSKANMQRKCK